MGRPSDYSEEKADAICDRLAEGEYLTDICQLSGFPTYKTYRRWAEQNETFAKRIVRAHEDQTEYFRDRIMRLNDGMTAENWQYTNAQIRNIQWLMGKIKPKYGDKVQSEVSGPNGGPIQFQAKSILES
jgi:hypothetical protein